MYDSSGMICLGAASNFNCSIEHKLNIRATKRFHEVLGVLLELVPGKIQLNDDYLHFCIKKEKIIEKNCFNNCSSNRIILMPVKIICRPQFISWAKIDKMPNDWPLQRETQWRTFAIVALRADSVSIRRSNIPFHLILFIISPSQLNCHIWLGCYACE